MTNTATSAEPPVRTIREFWSLLHAIELEAAERYAELADQMETHNNKSVAKLFRKLSQLERTHAEKLRAAGADVEPMKPRRLGPEGGLEHPETMPFTNAHYLMTPYHALVLALENETKAAQYFEALAARVTDAAVRALAVEMAQEERRHADLLRGWIGQFPEPGPDWDEDPDPPHFSE